MVQGLVGLDEWPLHHVVSVYNDMCSACDLGRTCAETRECTDCIYSQSPTSQSVTNLKIRYTG